MEEKDMTFEEFLSLIRAHIGSYCRDSYWQHVYDTLEKKTEKYVLKEMPYLAVNAVATDYTSTHG